MKRSAFNKKQSRDATARGPQGFGCSTIAVPGRHLGKRIKFDDCPPDVKKCILQDLEVPRE